MGLDTTHLASRLATLCLNVHRRLEFQIFIDYKLTTQLNHFCLTLDRWRIVECFQFDLSPRSHGSLGTFFLRLPTVDLYAFSRLPVACSPSQFAESLLPGMPCRRSNNVTSFSQPSHKLLLGQRRLLWVILVGSEVQFFSVFDR